MWAGRMQSGFCPTCCQVEGRNPPLWSLVLGFPPGPGQGQAETQPLCKNKKVAFEKVCPLPQEGTFAVKSVHGIFIPLTQPRQDLVHKFSRGNAFTKNLMGSGSSAESPYKFHAFLGSLVWAGAHLQSVNGLLSGRSLEQRPVPSPLLPREAQGAEGGASLRRS